MSDTLPAALPTCTLAQAGYAEKDVSLLKQTLVAEGVRLVQHTTPRDTRPFADRGDGAVPNGDDNSISGTAHSLGIQNILV